MALQTWVLIWFGVFGLAVIALSIYSARGTYEDPETYFVSDWKTGSIIVAATASATWFSGGAYVGLPGLTYAFGFAAPFYFALVGWVGLVIGVVLLAGPLQQYSKALSALSISELLEKRYGSKFVRILSAIYLILFFIPLLIAQAKAGSAVLQVTAGLSNVNSLIIFGALMGIIVALGGFRGVAWTDAMFLFLMLAVSIIITSTAIIKAGGPVTLIQTVSEQSPSHLQLVREPIFSPIESIGLVITFFLGTIALPHSITRFMGMEDADSDALRRVMISLLSFTSILMFLAVFLGIAGFAIRPDLANPDLIVPTLIESFFSDPIAGFFTVAILGAIITTLSTTLLLVITAVSNDIMNTYTEFNDKKTDLVSRGSTLAVVALVIFLATNTLEFIVILQSLTYVSLGILFFFVLTIGFYWKTANKYGVIAGIVVMTIVTPYVFAVIGASLGMTAIYSTIALTISFVGVSLVTSGEQEMEEFYDRIESVSDD